MKVNRYITFNEETAPRFTAYLKKNNIMFESDELVSVLNMTEDDPWWNEVKDFIGKELVTDLPETIFSTEELNRAEWLTMRSCWHYSYPQPEDRYKDVTYDSGYCQKCGCGLVQKDAFRIKKAPNWGRRHVFQLNWVFDELFLSNTARGIFESADISGISFREVKNKSGEEIVSDVHQLVISHILPAGIVTKGKRSIDDVYDCSSCKTKKYHPTGIGMLAFDRYIFDNAPDIVKTGEEFGWGCGADRIIIVNQKVYQIIKQNKMDRSLVFEPIELV